MNVKRKLCDVLTHVALLILAALIPRVPAAPSDSAAPGTISLIGLLPDATVLAVELRDVATRWPEIRDVPAISRFQDRLFDGRARCVDILPRVAGERAVMALVLAPDRRSLAPLAVLRPPRVSEALEWLEECHDASLFTVRQQGDTLWIVPAGVLDLPSTPARSQALQRPDERLPEGGLIRGWFDPGALGDLLRSQIEGTRPPWLELLGSLAASELDAMRFASFRRDLTADGIVTDVVLGYDTDRLPSAVTRFLAGPAGISELPRATPAGVLTMSSFPLAPDAGLAWLRYAAESDPRGPLRNLDFWIEELEARTGLRLERDLLDALGERGWLFVLEGETPDTVGVVAILEARDARRVEQTLVRMVDWLKGHVAGRSLGMTLPRVDTVPVEDRLAQVMTFWSPFAETPGPAFLTTDDHVLLGSGEQALRVGLSLLEDRDTWRAVREGGAAATPVHESTVVQGAAIMPLLDVLIEDASVDAHRGLVEALVELVTEVDRAVLDVRYEGDVVRVHSRVEFRPLEGL